MLPIIIRRRTRKERPGVIADCQAEIKRTVLEHRSSKPIRSGPVPGLKCRPRKGDTTAWYWIARASAIGKRAADLGFAPLSVRLHGSTRQIKERAQRLYDDAVEFLSEIEERKQSPKAAYDGTLGSLIMLYFSQEYSGFSKLKYSTQKSYRFQRLLLKSEAGDWEIKKITRKDCFDLHKKIASERGMVTASTIMQHLRMTVRFGIDLDDACARAAGILSAMQFEGSPGRSEYLTAAMVAAFRAQAHKMGHPIMALGQAIQFETALRQKDVIGEWIPDEVPVIGRMRTVQTETWANGLVWELHVSSELIQGKRTSKSKGRKVAISDWSMCPMVMEELELIPTEQRQGPIMVNPKTGLPFKVGTFRNLWREIANAAGIPADHCNMDSRSGAITEGGDSGADEDHLRQFGTHSQKRQTQHYNRATLAKARQVHAARSAHRAAGDAAATAPPLLDAPQKLLR